MTVAADAQTAPLPVTVIGGYLGAGKTTLVNNLLRQADGRRLAIMVNEFGALPIDRDLIVAEEDTIITLAGGCVCCSYGEDLVSSMAMLAGMTPRPDHVLLEASGVAFPGAIAGTVGLLQDFALDGVIVLADAETVQDRATDKYLGSTIRRQLVDADLIVLNKTDLAADPAVVNTWIASVAPAARRISAIQCDVPLQAVLGSSQHDEAPPSLPPSHAHHADGYATFRFDPTTVDDPAALAAELAAPALGLLRAKGFVTIRDKAKIGIQVVGNRWSVSPAAADVPTGLVCIGLRGSVDEPVLSAIFDDKKQDHSA